MAQTPEGTSSFKDLSAANLLELLFWLSAGLQLRLLLSSLSSFF